MNSRCLYCDKRLSLFHGKKKPYCSDDHEDLYLQRQAVSGLDRLRVDSLDVVPARPVKPILPPTLKAPEQFVYPELEPGFFDDDPEPITPQIFSLPPQRSADGIPPPADYLISSANAVQPAAPTIPFRDPARATFSAAAWTRSILLEGFGAWLTPSSPAIQDPPEKSEPPPPPLVTSLERLPMPLFTFASFTASVDTSKVSAMVDLPGAGSLPRLEALPLAVTFESPPSEAGPPAMMTDLVSVQITALRLADPDSPRTFRDYTLDVAVPRLVYPPPHRAPKFDGEARPTEVPSVVIRSQPLGLEPLPQVEPLRLRTLLDLRGSAFRTLAHRLTPAPLAPLSWHAAPPEAVIWPLTILRRRPVPVLPRIQEQYL